MTKKSEALFKEAQKCGPISNLEQCLRELRAEMMDQALAKAQKRESALNEIRKELGIPERRLPTAVTLFEEAKERKRKERENWNI